MIVTSSSSSSSSSVTALSAEAVVEASSSFPDTVVIGISVSRISTTSLIVVLDANAVIGRCNRGPREFPEFPEFSEFFAFFEVSALFLEFFELPVKDGKITVFCRFPVVSVNV